MYAEENEVWHYSHGLNDCWTLTGTPSWARMSMAYILTSNPVGCTATTQTATIPAGTQGTVHFVDHGCVDECWAQQMTAPVPTICGPYYCDCNQCTSVYINAGSGGNPGSAYTVGALPCIPDSVLISLNVDDILVISPEPMTVVNGSIVATSGFVVKGDQGWYDGTYANSVTIGDITVTLPAGVGHDMDGLAQQFIDGGLTVLDLDGATLTAAQLDSYGFRESCDGSMKMYFGLLTSGSGWADFTFYLNPRYMYTTWYDCNSGAWSPVTQEVTCDPLTSGWVDYGSGLYVQITESASAPSNPSETPDCVCDWYCEYDCGTSTWGTPYVMSCYVGGSVTDWVITDTYAYCTVLKGTTPDAPAGTPSC